MELHVALNVRAAPDITKGCPWIAKTYHINLDDFNEPESGRATVARLPRQWDYIIEDTTALDAWDDAFVTADERATARLLRNYYALINTMLVATRGRGTTNPSLRLPEGLGYRPQAEVRISVPEENKAFAERYAHDGPSVCVLLGGSDSYFRYPDVSSWIKILDAIRKAFPGVRFYLTGLRSPVGGETYTAGYSDGAIREVLDTGSDVVDCYDIGLWNQLALMERCDVFLSPHTGFAFLAPCVGTPWLALSGGDWPEYFFNNVPFYSVLPDNPDFPYQSELYPRGTTTKHPCMRPENLDRKIPEVVEGMRLLLRPDFTYARSVERYRENIARANVKRESLPLPDSPSLADF